MELVNIFKIIGISIGVCSALIGAIMAIINNIAQKKSHQKIVYNDLHHLSADVKVNTTKIEKLNDVVGEINANVNYIKGKMDKDGK